MEAAGLHLLLPVLRKPRRSARAGRRGRRLEGLAGDWRWHRLTGAVARLQRKIRVARPEVCSAADNAIAVAVEMHAAIGAVLQLAQQRHAGWVARPGAVGLGLHPRVER